MQIIDPSLQRAKAKKKSLVQRIQVYINYILSLFLQPKPCNSAKKYP